MTVEGMMRELRKIRPSILSGLWDLLGDITRETVEKTIASVASQCDKRIKK